MGKSLGGSRQTGKAHVGRVFEICVEKGSELPKGSPLRKFKGRTVFQGNNVQDENSNTALFSELGSSTASMEAGKVLDAYGSQPGFACEQADGKQAYTQTTLKGAETWVRLPRERWPKSWIENSRTQWSGFALRFMAILIRGAFGRNIASKSSSRWALIFFFRHHGLRFSFTLGSACF